MSAQEHEDDPGDARALEHEGQALRAPVGVGRGADGRMQPGHTANPAGMGLMIKGAGQLARMLAHHVRDQTDDMRELYDILLGIARGVPSPSGAIPSVIQQRAAAEYLIDRVIGRPTQPVSVDADAGPGVVDVAAVAGAAGLSLDALEAMLDAALGDGPIGRVIEARAVQVSAEAAAAPRPNAPASAITDVPAPYVPSAIADPFAGLPTPARLPRRLRLPQSRQIYRADWDPDTGDLVVTFGTRHGQPHARWLYERVTRRMVDEWEKAPSAGAWYARELRGAGGSEDHGVGAGLHLKIPRRRLADMPYEGTEGPDAREEPPATPPASPIATSTRRTSRARVEAAKAKAQASAAAPAGGPETV